MLLFRYIIIFIYINIYGFVVFIFHTLYTCCQRIWFVYKRNEVKILMCVTHTSIIHLYACVKFILHLLVKEDLKAVWYVCYEIIMWPTLIFVIKTHTQKIKKHTLEDILWFPRIHQISWSHYASTRKIYVLLSFFFVFFPPRNKNNIPIITVCVDIFFSHK